MPGSVTAKPGPYRLDWTPYAKGIQDAFDDDGVQVTVLCLGARLGKTEAFLNLMGRTMDVDPANMLVTYPTLESAKVFFAESVQPMLDASRCFRGKVSSIRKKDGRNTQLKKRFPGGVLRGIGANVPSAFRGVQARVVIGDEIDAMEPSKEGDPIDLLLKRAENYPNAIQVLSSTPTTVGESRIWEWLGKSDWCKWFVPSPFGNHWHVLDWANVRWDDGKPETARYVDPVTGDAWTEAQRRDAIANGEWRATQPFGGVRGFWADGLVSLFPPKRGYVSKLHQFAAEFLQANGQGRDGLQVWHNTFRCLPWQEASEVMDWEMVAERVEDYDTNPLPDRVLVLTLAADVQADRIEFEWVGWADDYEHYALKYGVFMGDPKRPDVWTKLAAELRQTWKHPSVGEMKLTRAFIDEGGIDGQTQTTRRFCLSQLSQGIDIYPCQGVGRTGVVEPELVSLNPKRRQKGIVAPTFNIGVSIAKRTIYGHLMAEGPGPNVPHWPNGYGYDDRYFQMLTAERVITKYQYGRPYKVFECPSGKRNEALDIRVYGYAAAVSLNPNWDALRQNQSRRSKPPPLAIPKEEWKTVSAAQAQKELTNPQTPRRERRMEARRPPSHSSF